VVAAVLGAHAFEYRRASAQLERIEAALETAVDPTAPLASVTVWSSRTQGACVAEALPSVGVPSLKWFGLVRVIASGGLGSRLMETSLVDSRLGRHDPYPLLVELVTPDEPVPALARQYRSVLFFGCARDIRSVAETLPRSYHVVAEGAGFAVLTRDAAPGDVDGLVPVTRR